MRTSQGPSPMQTTYTWADEDGSTRMTLESSGEPSGLRGSDGAHDAPCHAQRPQTPQKNPQRRLIKPDSIAPWGSLIKSAAS